MKIEELAFAVAGETLELLEQKYHYRIPDEHKLDIQRLVQTKLNDILTQAKKTAAEQAVPEGEQET